MMNGTHLTSIHHMKLYQRFTHKPKTTTVRVLW